MLSKFVFTALFSAVATSFLAAAAYLSPVLAQSPAPSANAAGDNLILEMNQAFRRSDRKRLSMLLPQVRCHALEPWAAYWELRARLGEASSQEVQDYLTRFAGT